MHRITDFDIDINKIDMNLSIYLDIIDKSFNESSKMKIRKNYSSFEDYLHILYWLRFVKHLNYPEIGKALGSTGDDRSFAYRQYFALGLNYSFNFKETEEKVIQNKLRINNITEKVFAINLREELDFSQQQWDEYYKLLKEYTENATHLTKGILKKYGFKSSEHCFDVLFYLSKVENLSTLEISQIFKISTAGIGRILKSAGLLLNAKSAQKEATRQGRRNYKNTFETGKVTLRKNVLINGGSNIEVFIRENFAMFLSSYLDKDTYEVIIGISNRNIISPLEVDIPIIVINIKNSKFFKFAIEVNGDIFHSDESRELIKNDELTNSGWILFTIWQGGSKEIQKKYGEINQQIENLCMEIGYLIKNN